MLATNLAWLQCRAIVTSLTLCTRITHLRYRGRKATATSLKTQPFAHCSLPSPKIKAPWRSDTSPENRSGPGQVSCSLISHTWKTAGSRLQSTERRFLAPSNRRRMSSRARESVCRCRGVTEIIHGVLVHVQMRRGLRVWVWFCCVP